MRKFKTGATRDNEDTKIDFEGFYHPLVVERFGEYMHKHRVQADGELRDSDNWQKGIPKDALCGLLFNVQGYLYEILKHKESLTHEEVWETVYEGKVVRPPKIDFSIKKRKRS